MEKEYKLIQETQANFAYKLKEATKEGFVIISNITTCKIQDALYNTILLEKN